MDPLHTPQNAREEIDARIKQVDKQMQFARTERDRLRKQAEQYEALRVEAEQLAAEWRDIRKALYGDR